MLIPLLRQLASLLLTAAATLSIVFFAMGLLPGDAASLAAGIETAPEQVDAIRRGMGLDAPPLRRFAAAWSDLLRGDLGDSLREGRPVGRIIAERLPVTFGLALLAFLLSLIIGLSLGALAGRHPGGRLDRITLAYTTLGLTLPEFWLGFLLLLLLSVQLGWFPLLGLGSGGDALSRLHHLLLPAITLALPRAAQLARLARAQVMEESGADYVRTAVGKGLPTLRVHAHVAANALPRLLPLVALELGGLLTGTLLVEQVFSLPGLGTALLGAISARDVPVVQGLTVFGVGVYVLVNGLADLLQLLADPRLRYGA